MSKMPKIKKTTINKLDLNSEVLEVISKRYATVVDLWESIVVHDENDNRLNHPYFTESRYIDDIKKALNDVGFCSDLGVREFILYIRTDNTCYTYLHDYLIEKSIPCIAAKYGIDAYYVSLEVHKAFDIMNRFIRAFTSVYSCIFRDDCSSNDYLILNLSPELNNKLFKYEQNHRFFSYTGGNIYTCYRSIYRLLNLIEDDQFVDEADLDERDKDEIYNKYKDLKSNIEEHSIRSRVDDIMKCRFDSIGFPYRILDKLSQFLSKSSKVSDLKRLLDNNMLSLLNDCELEEVRNRLQNFIKIYGYILPSKTDTCICDHIGDVAISHRIGSVVAYHKIDCSISSIAWGIIINRYIASESPDITEYTILPIQSLCSVGMISCLENSIGSMPALQKSTKLFRGTKDSFGYIVDVNEDTFIVKRDCTDTFEPNILFEYNHVTDEGLLLLCKEITQKEEE